MRKDATDLAIQFAEAVLRQQEAVFRGDSRGARKWGNRMTRSWEQVSGLGETGFDAMLGLLQHAETIVRIDAAVALLHYRHERAMAVLRTIADSAEPEAGMAAEALKRWDEGAVDF